MVAYHDPKQNANLLAQGIGETGVMVKSLPATWPLGYRGSLTNSYTPQNRAPEDGWLGDYVHFWEGLFSGAMVVSGSVRAGFLEAFDSLADILNCIAFVCILPSADASRQTRS